MSANRPVIIYSENINIRKFRPDSSPPERLCRSSLISAKAIIDKAAAAQTQAKLADLAACLGANFWGLRLFGLACTLAIS